MEARHAQLFPALFKAAPGLFDPPEAFSLDAFLWASQLWCAAATVYFLSPGVRCSLHSAPLPHLA